MSRAFKLTENSDIDKYKYSAYGIGFDRRRTFSCPNAGFGCNVLTFSVGMSSPVHLDQKKYVLILVIRQGFDGIALTAEKQYSINFTVTKKKLFKFPL